MDNWQIIIGFVCFVFLVRAIEKRFLSLENQLLEIQSNIELLLNNMEPEYDEVIGEWINHKGQIVDRFTKNPTR